MSKCIRCGKEIITNGDLFCADCERDVGGDAINNWKSFTEDVTDKFCRGLGREVLKDSGERRQFFGKDGEALAVRDMSYGKGDMVSLPNAAILRLSKHYEVGATKYGRWNYTKGIPVSSFMDSALRHIFKYLDGWDDEDHLAAAAFNILGAMEMEEHHPDMCDLPTREGKNKFKYGE